MQIPQIALPLLGLALTLQGCEARSLYQIPNGVQRRATKAALSQAITSTDIKSFVISQFSAMSVAIDAAGTGYNNTLTFNFMDPNSNTNTSCTKSWTDQKGSTANAPTNYQQCDNTTNTIDEHFQWQFVSAQNLSSFVIEFAHGFDDPANYPPPYSYVQYFSENTLNLTCTDTQGASTCVLPNNQSSLTAPITSISN